MSPTHFVSNIRHQYRRSHIGNMHWMHYHLEIQFEFGIQIRSYACFEPPVMFPNECFQHGADQLVWPDQFAGYITTHGRFRVWVFRIYNAGNFILIYHRRNYFIIWVLQRLQGYLCYYKIYTFHLKLRKKLTFITPSSLFTNFLVTFWSLSKNSSQVMHRYDSFETNYGLKWSQMTVN